MEDSAMYRVVTEALNLRTEPDPGSSRLLILAEGTEVKKLSDIETAPKWWKVEANIHGNAISGYVAHRYLAPITGRTYNPSSNSLLMDEKKVNPSVRNQVFISYSHKDVKWLQRLQVHLKPLERSGTITRWDDTLLTAGASWREEIKKALQTTKVAVLLISADFLASDFIISNELPPLLAAAEAEGAVILPVILSYSRFERTESISRYQAVNSPSQPLADMSRAKQEAVLVRVSEAIEIALRR
jgi:TIR domain/Bacterial SH3 domain